MTFVRESNSETKTVVAQRDDLFRPESGLGATVHVRWLGGVVHIIDNYQNNHVKLVEGVDVDFMIDVLTTIQKERGS